LLSAIIAWISWKLAIGRAELLALRSIGHAVGEQPFGHAHADRRDVQPPAIQHLHGHLEALALLAQAVPGRHADIVEGDVVDVGPLLAHLLLGLADRKPGRSRGTRKAETPEPPLASGLVRAITVNSEALPALVM
jgi:hypothetical protein